MFMIILMYVLGLVITSGTMYVVNKEKMMFTVMPFALLALLSWIGLAILLFGGLISALIHHGADHISALDAKFAKHFKKDEN